MQKSKEQIIVLPIIATFCFGLNPTIQKIAQNGLNPQAVVFLVCLFAAIFIFIVSRIQNINLKISKKEFFIFILLGILSYLATFCSNKAYNYIPVHFASAIHFVYPALICASRCFMLKKK